MQATPVRGQALAENLRAIFARINAAAPTGHLVRLVAVSKLKPASDVLALYSETGHQHMGENYVQELLEKARVLPRDIKWHFIGQLQTNKCRKLAEEIPNLWAVESVDTSKKADALEKGRATLTATSPNTPKLRIYVQVNTSGEAAKSGCAPSEAIGIACHIKESCPHLSLQGIMTIGSIVRSRAKGEENQDFLLLNETAKTVERELGIELELSIGMSNDFEEAIKLGARNVRKQKYPRGLVARADIAIELEQQFLVNVRRNQTKMRKRIHRLHRGSKVRAELDWRLRLAHGQRSITGVSY